ncbi:hypothetical protein F140042L4_21180 [Coprococcus phoceensis]
MNEIILQNKDGKILASSRDVAEKFGKNHKEILRSISNISKEISTAQFCALFKLSNYKASNGKTNKEYLMNRDGFSLLCMGFTGKEALEWKLKYIEAFNKMEEKLKSSNILTDEEKLKLQLFSKDPAEVAYAHNKLVEIATAPLIAENTVMKPKANYHDEVLNKDDLINTTVIAKDLGLRSAAKLNNIMHSNNIIFKNSSGTWCPYADYEWLITENYADYKSYNVENSNPCLKWTEKGRKWIIENYGKWICNSKN